MKRLAHFIYYKKKLIIGIVVLFNIIALLSFYNFRFSTDYLSFFKGNHDMSAAYDEISSKYDGIETIQVLIETDSKGSLLEKSKLIETARYMDQIENIEGITFIQSFIPKQFPSREGIIRLDKNYIQSNYEKVVKNIQASTLSNELIAKDQTLGLIMIGMSDQGDMDQIIDKVKAVSIGEQLSLSYAGNQIIVNTMFEYLWKIILILPPLAIFLVLLTFYLNIKVKKLTILAMLPAAFGALWTFGTIFLLGKELSVITVIAPIFIIVLGSADGLHFTIHYLDHSHKKKDKVESIEETLRMVGVPIIMTTLTTMAGFLSLSFSDVVSMQDLGITTALGIGYAGIISIFFLPAILSKIDISNQVHLEAKEHRLIQWMKALVKRKVAIVAFFLIVVVSLGSFIPTLIVDSNQLAFFKKGSDIRNTFDKIENHFGSPMPIIGEYKKPESGLLDSSYAKEILEQERNLEKEPGIEKVVSVYDLILSSSKQMTESVTYPEQEKFLSNLLTKLNQSSIFNLDQWVSDDGIKFMITTNDMSGEEQDILIEELKNKTNILSLTGMPILFREMNKLIVKNQISSLFIALLLVTIMLGISFRNLKNTLVALLPIIITVISLFGFLALTNMNLNMMTANMSSIAIGVGIDYSIHFISVMTYYQRKKEKHFIEKTLETAGRPILTNALGLAIGLSVYMLSPFRIHSQVSMIMWLAMILSSLSALLLIPQFYRKRNDKSFDKNISS